MEINHLISNILPGEVPPSPPVKQMTRTSQRPNTAAKPKPNPPQTPSEVLSELTTTFKRAAHEAPVEGERGVEGSTYG